ncbi:MAG: cytochrome c, partial [Gammaproteobacteria bacterium]|nr:cytochrome c [Gammaproteobacteria bacterium]
MRRFVHLLIFLAVLLAFAALALVALNLRGEDPLPERAEPFASTPAQVERGRYLALAGNCAGCHTTRGGQPYAGGVGIQTPFGTVFASNLTPSSKAGIGQWSAAEFWRAMHNGRSKDGRLLYPAFPYPNFTRVTREDSDAIFAFLRTQPSADTPNIAHRLRFPYDSQIALAAWRALYFEPQRFEPAPARSAEWNRGAYLVEGLGHCIACHGQRNSLGAIQSELGLAGGLIAGENWYAPSLRSKREAGVADWDAKDVVALLKTGVAPRGSVMGPMADVVYGSTQHLNEADLNAMAAYLKQLPASASDAENPDARAAADSTDAARAPGAPTRRDAGALRRGQ